MAYDASEDSDDFDAADELAQALMERKKRMAMAQTNQQSADMSPLGSALAALGSGWAGGLLHKDGGEIYRQNVAARQANAANQAKLAALDDAPGMKALTTLATLQQKANAPVKDPIGVQVTKNDGAVATQKLRNEGALAVAGKRGETTQSVAGVAAGAKTAVAGIAAKAKAGANGLAPGGKASTADDRLAMVAADKIHKDPSILQMYNTKLLTERALGILSRPGLTNQEFNDAQIEVSNAVAGARSAAMGKLERTEYDTYGQRISELLQKVTGQPQDAVSPEILDRAKSLASEMVDRFSQNMSARAQSLGRSYSSPRAQKNQDDAIAKYRYEKPAAPAQKIQIPYAPGQAPGTVLHGGGIDTDVSKLSREEKIKIIRGH